MLACDYVNSVILLTCLYPSSHPSTESGLDETDGTDGTDYSMLERFPAAQHTGLPPAASLTAHCAPSSSSFVPVERSQSAEMDTALSTESHGADAYHSHLLNAIGVGRPHAGAPSLGAIDHLQRLNLVAHVTGFASSFLPALPPAAPPRPVIDLCEDGGAESPIELLSSAESAACAAAPAEQAIAAMRTKSLHSLVDLCKPSKATEFIGNADSIQQLEEWLMTWAGKSRTPSWMKQKAVSEKQRKKSKYEYESSDEDEEDNICNVATLYGPSGTGKTALVSALAKQIGYNVIEIRANEVRSGTAVNKMFAEATKSHGLKSGAEKGRKKSSSSVLNLILFDEVDLDFEEDVGFHQAIQALAKSTRTPIVLTTENEQLPFLNRIQTEFIFFDKPTAAAAVEHLAAVLRATETMSSASAERLAGILVTANECDIRRSLHQLHLLMPSLSKEGSSVAMERSFQQYLSSVGLDFARFDDMPTLLHESFAQAGAEASRGSDSDTASLLQSVINSLKKKVPEICTPSLCDVSPRRGDRRGGFVVTVDGKNFLQRVRGEMAAILVFVGDVQVPDGNVRVLSDTELVFLAPNVPLGGVLSVVVALELSLAPGEGYALLRSDTRGMAGSLHFEMPPENSDIRYYFGKHSSKPAGNQLTLTVKRRTKRPSEYIDSSSGDEESAPPAQPIKRTARIQRQSMSDDEELVDPEDPAPATEPQGGGSGLKRKRVILDDDEDCTSESVSLNEVADDAVDMPNAVEAVAHKPLSLSSEDAKDIMTRALELVMAHPRAAPFLAPVSNSDVADYSEVISQPMDLGTIATRCQEGFYMKESALNGLEAMVEDVRLVWSNCYTYNKPTSGLCSAAQYLSKMFERSLAPSVQEFGVVLRALPAWGVVEAAEEEEDAAVAQEVIDLVQTEEEKPYVEEELPEHPSQEALQADLLVAETKRTQERTSVNRSYGTAGAEYDECSLAAFPPCLPQDMLPSACAGNAKDAFAVHRGDLAALQLLSSMHDIWATADVLGAYAMRADAEDEVDRANLRSMAEPMARRLTTASIPALTTWSLGRLGNEFSAANGAHMRLSQCAFVSSIDSAMTTLSATASTESSEYEATIQNSSGERKDLASTNPTDAAEDSSDKETVRFSKKAGKSRRSVLTSSDSEEEEAQFGHSSDEEYVSDRAIHTLSARQLSASPLNFSWRKCGAEFGAGFLRFAARRKAYTACAFDELSIKALTADQWKAFGSSARSVPRHVALETIPFVGKMVYWDSVFGVTADSRSGSSRRSARASAPAARYPYSSRVTKLSDAILEKLTQFAKVGESVHAATLSCAWE